MKNNTRYIICAISLLLILSLILDAFADDDCYRGGAQKVDNDNGDHDRSDYLRPVTNQTYKETCGECHFVYQPELLSSGSWINILNQFDDHFREEIKDCGPGRNSDNCHCRRFFRCFGYPRLRAS
jgi:hypothetical protein